MVTCMWNRLPSWLSDDLRGKFVKDDTIHDLHNDRSGAKWHCEKSTDM
jgi:hypothetical protein